MIKDQYVEIKYKDRELLRMNGIIAIGVLITIDAVVISKMLKK